MAAGSRTSSSSRSRKKSAGGSAWESSASKTSSQPGEVPLVGGFFLPKRQVQRAVAILTVLVAAVAYSTQLGGSVKEVLLDTYRWPLHVFCFSTWFGCSMWVSFVAGLVMFHNLPRHVFGRLQAKLFPRYFQFSVIFVGGCLLLEAAVRGLALTGPSTTTSTLKSTNEGNVMPTPQLYNLLAVLAILLLNLLYFEPKTTAVMYERHKVEIRLGTGHEVGQLRPSDPEKANDPELVALSKKFGKLHGVSTSLNLLGLCLGTWHAVWIGSNMQLQIQM
eukprot:g752.t1